MAKPVLVTGASGFVGSAVVRALLAEGRQVRVLVRPSSDRRNVEGLPVEVRMGQLEDRASLASALEGCGTLFHVAADYRLLVRDPASMYAVNVDGTRHLMASARAVGVERIVYTSSVATLGILPDGTPSDETTPSRVDDMMGHYKRSKFLAEEVVREMVRTEGLPAVIVCPSTPIGPRDVKPTPTGRIIVKAANGGFHGAYVDTGLNLVHVDDVATGHLLAEKRGRVGERYILGGEDMRLVDILREVANLVGKYQPRFNLPVRPLVPIAIIAETLARYTGRDPMISRDALRMARKKMFFSSAKAQRDLGYRARPALEGITEALAWFRAAGMCR